LFLFSVQPEIVFEILFLRKSSPKYKITQRKTTKLLLTTVAATNCWVFKSGACKKSVTSWCLINTSSLNIVHCSTR